MKDKENKVLIMINLEAYKGDKPYIFVSYAHKDINYVYPEILRLHDSGCRIWYDEGIEPGQKFWKEIAAAIKNCFIFIVFISPDAIKSASVTREISFALKHEIKLLPIYLKETELSQELQIQIDQYQAIMKYNLTEEMYNRKVAAVLPKEVTENKENNIDIRKVKRKFLENTAESLFSAGGQKDYEYHIFITFRNLDEAGDPTYESILALKIFRFLSEKGLQVFHNIKSIEHMAAKEAEIAIAKALESSQILLVVAMSPENIIFEKVHSEWERFNKLITDGFKPGGVLISYINGFDSMKLPEILRKNKVIIDDADSYENLYRLVIDTVDIDVETFPDDEEFKKVFEKNSTFWLSRVSGEGPDNIIITAGEVKTVGRSADNDVILNLRQVSQFHAKIRYSKDGIIVDDLGSTNGTRVNNKKITSKKLQLGDVVKFDAVSYQLRLPPEKL